MKRFSELILQLDQTTKTNRKLEAIVQYFRESPPSDAMWALYFLCGNKFKRSVTSAQLRGWAAELAQIPDWLFDECYEAVGDLAETISLIIPHAFVPPMNGDRSESEDRPKNEERSINRASSTLNAWVAEVIEPLTVTPAWQQKKIVIDAWGRLGIHERLVFNKLLTGSFRIGVAKGLVIRALASATGLTTEVITHRLMGNWKPSLAFFEGLSNADTQDTQVSQPYPFFLANPMESDPELLGSPSEWMAEWKWDGIRAQLIRRGGQSFVWSRGDELMTDRFPELHSVLRQLPNGTVLDGEIVAYRDQAILPFTSLQRRIGLKKASKKILNEIPVTFIAFDILEHQSQDIRAADLAYRRQVLDSVCKPLLATPHAEDEVFQLSNEPFDQNKCLLLISESLGFQSWEDLALLRQDCRNRSAEGVMLKRWCSPYRVGRPRGDWWKWKIEPYSVDAVLIYAQRGHGRRASLFSDYTFAVWDGSELVPFAKAYSGLTDEEMKQVDAFVRKNTTERFGSMVKVVPELVFELGFENIQLSSRHKSGVAVRFPRILHWRHDKRPSDADSLETIRRMLVHNLPNRTT